MASVLRTRVFPERRELYMFRGPLSDFQWDTRQHMHVRNVYETRERIISKNWNTQKPINTAFPSYKDGGIPTLSTSQSLEYPASYFFSSGE